MIQEKENWNYIFEGISEDFKLHWKEKSKVDELKEEEKEKCWKYLSEWIDKFSLLIHSVIPEHQTTCVIETKQEYRDFSKEDIICVIENIGKVSQHMYCAKRDYFNSVYLDKYYIYALEYITWLSASFVNLQKNYCDFISLKERLESLFNSTKESKDKKNLNIIEKIIDDVLNKKAFVMYNCTLEDYLNSLKEQVETIENTLSGADGGTIPTHIVKVILFDTSFIIELKGTKKLHEKFKEVGRIRKTNYQGGK